MGTVSRRESRAEDVTPLFERLVRTRDPELRTQLIERYRDLVRSVARRYASVGEPVDDLVQEGTMGLIHAVDMFDPTRGVKFTTYATHLISGHIQHYLRDKGRLIRQPAWVQEATSKLRKAHERLSHELGREPTSRELAAAARLSENTVGDVLRAQELSWVVPLETSEGDDETHHVEEEKVVEQAAGETRLPLEDRILLERTMGRLKDLEQKVLRYFFFLDLNQSEIARRLGISVNYASYLLRGALAKLRQHFLATPDEPVPAASAGGPAPALKPDPVTGLPTGAYFSARLAEEAQRGARYPQHFSVLVVLHERADGSEPDAGELRVLGQSLRRQVRQPDIVSRLDGGAFALLLPHTGREARVLSERIADRCHRTQPGRFRVRIGFAVFPYDGRNATGLLEAARAAAEAVPPDAPEHVVRRAGDGAG